jgi:hypothetical protein
MELRSVVPDWRWGTAEGSREFDRWCDRELSFLEKVRWLEEAEALSLAMRLKRDSPLSSESLKSVPGQVTSDL